MHKAIRKFAMVFLVAVTACAGTSAHSRVATQVDPEAMSNATPIFARELPNVAGKSLLAVEVVYPPGGGSPSHRHPPSAFIYAYVVSGEIVSAVDDEKPRVYRAGESFYEAPGAHHRVSRNASRTKSAKLLAVFVKNTGKDELVLPDPK